MSEKGIQSPLNLQLSESINELLGTSEQPMHSEGQMWKLMLSYLKRSLPAFSLLPAGLAGSVNALSTLEWGISVLRKMSLFFTRSVWGHFRESHCESIHMALRCFSPGISLLKKLRNCGSLKYVIYSCLGVLTVQCQRLNTEIGCQHAKYISWRYRRLTDVLKHWKCG